MAFGGDCWNFGLVTAHVVAGPNSNGKPRWREEAGKGINSTLLT